MRKCRQYVYDAAERLFKAHTVRVVAHPRLVAAAVVVVTVLFSLGFMNLEINQQVLDLWMDGHSKASANRKYIVNHFDPAPRTLDVVLDGKSTNLLSKHNFDLVWALDAQIRALVADGYTFTDLCYLDGGSECVTEGALQFWGSNRTIYEQTVNDDNDILIAVNSGVAPDGTEVTTEGALGDVSFNASGSIISAGGLRIQYKIRVDDDKRTGKNRQLEKKFLNLVKHYHFPDVRLQRWATRTPEDEMARSLNSNVILLAIGYVLVIAFLSLVMMKGDWVQSRVLLGLGGLAVTAMGILSGYGLCAVAHVPFTLLQVILPFMVFGIGVNDMLIITSAYDATDRSLVPEERLKRSMHRSGLAITFTATAEVMAFLLGSISDIPVIESFCLYAAASIFFVYLYQITGFVVLVYWDACRIRNSHSDILCCIEVRPLVEEQPAIDRPKSRRLSSFNLPFSSHAKKEDPLYDDTDTMCKRFCSGFYLPPLVSDIGRIFFVLCFLAVTVLFAWAAVGTRRNFQVYDMFPDNSYGRDFAEAAKTLGVSPFTQFVPVELHMKDVGYSVPVQQEILDRSTRFIGRAHNTGPLTSWLAGFIDWASASPTYQVYVVDGTFSSEAELPQALGEFLCDDAGLRFRDDVMCAAGEVDCSLAIADMTCTPVRSRLNAYHTKLSSGSDKVSAMQDARDFWRRASLDPEPFPYSTQYLIFELLQGLYASLWQHFGFVLAAVAFVTFMILWEPWAAVVLCVVIFLIDVNLLGTATLAGMDINATTAAQVSMAAGLVIDYVGHPLHYFLMQDPALSTKDRVHDAMNEVGPVVILGAFTTLVGIVPLAFGNCVMYRNFFVMAFAIVIYSAAYGLMFLPAIISFQGQEYDTQMRKRKEVADPGRVVQIADVYVAQPLNKPEAIHFSAPNGNGNNNNGNYHGGRGLNDSIGSNLGGSPFKSLRERDGSQTLMVRTSNLSVADRFGSGFLETPREENSPESPTRHTPFSRAPQFSSKSSGSFGGSRGRAGTEPRVVNRQLEMQKVVRRL